MIFFLPSSPPRVLPLATLLRALVLSAFFLLLPAAKAAAKLRTWPPDLSPTVPGEVVVRWKEGTAPVTRAGALREALDPVSDAGASRVAVLRDLPHRLSRIRLARGTSVEEAVARLSAHPAVEWAQPNLRYMALQCVPADAYYNDDGQQWPFVQIRAPQAWARFAGCPATPPGSSSVTVAVVDSGVDSEHGDLSGKIVAGWDFVNNDADADDDNGHGTFVAGIVAAEWHGAALVSHCIPDTTAGGGMAGAGGQVRLMPLKVLDDQGFGDSVGIIAALDHAREQGVQVVNLSLGSPLRGEGEVEALDRALQAGLVVVAAAGNERGNLFFPAAHPPVIAVGATDNSGGVAFYSNRGAALDLVAPGGGAAVSAYRPGENIFSTVLRCPSSASASEYPRKTGDNFYGTSLGTSFAAPFVAAGAALLLALDPSLSNRDVADRLISSADDLGPRGWDPESGYGRLNLERALGGQTEVISFVRTFNSPNPFYPEEDAATNITLAVDRPVRVELVIRDAAGETVLRRTFEPQQLNENPANPQFKSFYVSWDGRNGAGREVVSGVYFYEVKTEQGTGRNKIALIRGRR